MAGTVVADTLQADSTSTLVLKNGVANTPPTIQDSAGTQIGTFCRAWVNYNGATASRVIRASFNVSSVTYNGAGDYTVNFTNALPDANYVITGSGGGFTANMFVITPADGTTARTTSACRVTNAYQNGGAALNDTSFLNIAIFR